MFMKKLTNVLIGAVYGAFAIGIVAVLAWALIGFVDSVQELNQYTEQLEELKAEKDELGYQYIISEINGDEVNGIALNRRSSDNGGIVLSKDIDNIDVHVGSIITVTYGEAFDDIKNIEIIE
jgi:hypothetical protein